MTLPDDIAIRMEGVGKRYRLGVTHDYRTLRDSIAGLFSPSPEAQNAPRSRKEIWAVRDLSFDVRKGEVVGIIGRNGSGKSTLLKLLTRITIPDTGRIEYDGRIGALLEVGTGFHPELTGRENVYMNGSILGMSQREIAKKFDEIVDFAGVEDFLDTPVKRYSSGMRVRLAFGIAAHLDPEILVVDEVLAVGDAAFQKKCLSRMNAVADEGRTVLFVSHQLDVVSGLCDRGIVLDNGVAVFVGPTQDAIMEYLSRGLTDGNEMGEVELSPAANAPYGFAARHLSLHVNGMSRAHAIVGEEVVFRIACACRERIANFECTIWIKDLYGRKITCLYNKLTGNDISVEPGRFFLDCRVNSFPVNRGDYLIDLSFSHGQLPLQSHRDVMRLSVIEGDFFKSGRATARFGEFLVAHDWSTHECAEVEITGE